MGTGLRNLNLKSSKCETRRLVTRNLGIKQRNPITGVGVFEGRKVQL